MCAVGAGALAFHAFQMHKLRVDPYRSWTDDDLTKLYYYTISWGLSAFSMLLAVPRYGNHKLFFLFYWKTFLFV
jgi:hypothetical protein